MKLSIIIPLLALLQFANCQNLRPADERELRWNRERFNVTCAGEQELAANECGLWRGKTGTLACREFKGWFGRPATNKNICVPNGFAKESDKCGCCEVEGCPSRCDPCEALCPKKEGEEVKVPINYTRTGKIRCVSSAQSVTSQLLGVYKCGKCE
jgi:hypothetical protein